MFVEQINSNYTLDELEKELRSGMLGWIKPKMKIITECKITNNDDYSGLERILSQIKEITKRNNIRYTEVLSIGGVELPDNYDITGIVHVIKLI